MDDMAFVRITVGDRALDYPVSALVLVLDLEREGFCLTLTPDHSSVSVWPAHELTANQRAQGTKYKSHLAVLLQMVECSCPRCRDLANVPITGPERAQLNTRLGKRQPRLIE